MKKDAARENYNKLKDYFENNIDDRVDVNIEFYNTSNRNYYVFIDDYVCDFGEERFGVLTEEMLKYERMFRKEYKNKEFDFDAEEKKRDYNKRFRDENPLTEEQKEERRMYAKQYSVENREKLSKRIRERLKTDHLFRLSCNYRSRTVSAFKSKGVSKKSKTREMLGCTFEEMKQYLINQFTEGMTVENYGEWHIDHIIPLASANTREELIKLIHYTNLQPLWASDNMSKGSKIL